MPSDEVFSFITDLVRSSGTYLYGGRMYETMAVWETDPAVAAQSELRSDFADVWQAANKVLDAYRSREVPLMWVVHPSAEPLNLGARLEVRGLVEAETCAGMVAELSQVPPPEPFPEGVTVDRLGPATRREFVELVAWRYSVPADTIAPLLSILEVHGFGSDACPTTAWVARLHGQVVAKAIVHLAEGVAGLYGVATRSDARGLGLARNLTMLAFDHARSLGYTVGVLHSTPMAVHLYASLGFSHVADFRLYSTPDTLHLSSERGGSHNCAGASNLRAVE